MTNDKIRRSIKAKEKDDLPPDDEGQSTNLIRKTKKVPSRLSVKR